MAAFGNIDLSFNLFLRGKNIETPPAVPPRPSGFSRDFALWTSNVSGGVRVARVRPPSTRVEAPAALLCFVEGARAFRGGLLVCGAKCLPYFAALSAVPGYTRQGRKERKKQLGISASISMTFFFVPKEVFGRHQVSSKRDWNCEARLC